MRLEIPRIFDGPLQLALNAGDQLFVVGANGSGKSALIQHFVSSIPPEKVRRISAHRQTWLQSEHIGLTPLTRHQIGEQILRRDGRDQARWMDEYAEQRQSAVLFDLVAKGNERANRIANCVSSGNIEEAIRTDAEVPSPLAQMNNLLALGNLAVQLESSSGDEILAHHETTGSRFSIAQMSDGERNATLIAANVLTVPTGTVLLIDEPERHLHRAIIEPFLTALFQQREDCIFVISTHETALPLANPEARVLITRSCTWEGNRAKAWEIDIQEPEADLPEDLKRAILGSRKQILFVEGDDSGSLDLPLYGALFPDISIVPKGGCAGVLRAVKGLREACNLHHVAAYGLIDKDSRPEDEVKQLAYENVFALDVNSVESLYYCSDSIAAVAQRQAETFHEDATQIIEKAHRSALTALDNPDLRTRMVAMRCEGQVRNRVMMELPTWETILANGEDSICVEFSSPLEDENKILETLIVNQDLNGLIARYPFRKSNVFDAIARSLKFSNRKDYEQALLTRIQADANLARKLKNRLRPLAKALER